MSRTLKHTHYVRTPIFLLFYLLPLNKCWTISQCHCLIFPLRALRRLQRKDPRQAELELLEQGFNLYINGAHVSTANAAHNSRSSRKTAQPLEAAHPPTQRNTRTAGKHSPHTDVRAEASCDLPNKRPCSHRFLQRECREVFSRPTETEEPHGT